MNDKKFLKTQDRVLEILEKDRASREDDIYLTWQVWDSMVPGGLGSVTMDQFKRLFLDGKLGLPASITRARAFIQNKKRPDLQGTVSGSKRKDRANFWTQWFKDNPNIKMTPTLRGILDSAETEIFIKELSDETGTGIDKVRETLKSIGTAQAEEDLEFRKQIQEIQAKRDLELISLRDFIKENFNSDPPLNIGSDLANEIQNLQRSFGKQSQLKQDEKLPFKHLVYPRRFLDIALVNVLQKNLNL